MKRLHLTLLAALLIGVVPLSASAAGWIPSDPLMPTGDSTLDTENLQTALHDPRLDTGGTLYLGPGTFRIHRFIGRQDISDPSAPSYSTNLFNGTIQGAGKGVTILRGVRGPGGVSFEPLHYYDAGIAYVDHTLLGFVQQYLGVKDLTFDSEATLVDPYNAYGNRGLVNYLGTGSFEYALNELIGTDITNVHFKGSLDSNGDPETPHLFQQWGDKGGVHNITSSEFENSSNGALQFFDIANATINVGGKRSDKVTFTDAARWALFFDGCTDCNVNVINNSFGDTDTAVYFASYWSGHESSLLVTGNDLQGSVRGVDIRDYSMFWVGIKSLDATISHNMFRDMVPGAWWEGAVYSRFVQGAVITNNLVTGQVASGAIHIRGDGNRLIGNNTQNVMSNDQAPPIWLWSTSSNNVVVGGGNVTQIVFDETDDPYTPEYDGTNILVGVNNAHINLGQQIRDAMSANDFDQ